MAAKLVGEISEEGVANIFAELVAEVVEKLVEEISERGVAKVLVALFNQLT